jgi:hypothetical protein
LASAALPTVSSRSGACQSEGVIQLTHSAVRSSVMLPLMCSVAGLASANNEPARAVYAASATIPTNMEGIRTFLAPPDGFDALAPADEELAAYGLPPRPDQVTDAAGYRVWAKAMSVHPQRWSGQLTPRDTQGGVAGFPLMHRQPTPPRIALPHWLRHPTGAVLSTRCRSRPIARRGPFRPPLDLRAKSAGRRPPFSREIPGYDSVIH